MPTNSDQFWSGPQGAAKFKHAVIKGQISAFAYKLGSAWGGTVSLIDGYAGPGGYDDGAPGSPMIALDVAEDLTKGHPSIQLKAQFIEKNGQYCARLTSLLQSRGRSDWPVYKNDCSAALPTALDAVGDEPLLVFLDPFGLGIPFDQLVNQVLRRDTGFGSRKPTEVIANFPIAALTRRSGFVEADFDDASTQLPPENLFGQGPPSPRTPQTVARLKRQQQAHLKNLNAFLGGEWWRGIRNRGGDWVWAVLLHWLAEIEAAAPGWFGVPVEVPDRWDGPAAYFLVLLTTQPVGAWAFNEAVSLAYEAMHRDTFSASTGQASLFDAEVLYVDPRQAWIEDLTDAIRPQLQAGMTGTCAENLEALYGLLIGKAREKHLRPALKQLHSEGLLTNPPKNRLDRYRLNRS